MLKHLLLFLLVLPFTGVAQILPKEGSKLNFRLVGFSFPAEKGEVKYIIEIAEGNLTTAAEFTRHIAVRHRTDKNEVMLEVPAFGKSYTWRAYTKDANVAQLHHFSTVFDDRVNARRLRVLQSNKELSGKCIVLDGSDLVYDAEGKLLAFLPRQNMVAQKDTRNISVTRDSTLTLLVGGVPQEMSLAGEVLWQASKPKSASGDPNESAYHHEFAKLPNGNYMAMGTEFLWVKQVARADTSYTLVLEPGQPDTGFSEGIFSTLIEFDKKGGIVWSWKDSRHLFGTDYDYFRWPEKQSIQLPGNGMNNMSAPHAPGMQLAANTSGNAAPRPPRAPTLPGRHRIPAQMKYDPHANSFFFDEKRRVLIVGYRNINRIIEIQYPSGEVINTYGAMYRPGVPGKCPDAICNLHGVKLSRSGDVYFFNNNTCNSTEMLPSLVVLRPGAEGGENTCSKIWEYMCSSKNVYTKRIGIGGNVSELEDGSFFASMGAASGKLFVVGRNKQETWSAQPEVYIPFLNAWIGVGQYRAEMIDRKEMESLVWKAEKLMTKT